jgi:hypothetical protein
MMIRPAIKAIKAKRHPLSMFLIILNKLGILQTQFKLSSWKTLLLAFWSLIPLSMVSDLLLPKDSQDDSLLWDITKVTNFSISFLDMTLPCCLVYFFFNNPALGGTQLAYLPIPKRIWLFLLSNFLGCCNTGLVCYHVMGLFEYYDNLKWISSIVILIITGSIFDLTIRFCLCQVVGSTAERFQRSILKLSQIQENKSHNSDEDLMSDTCQSASSDSYVIQKSNDLLNEYKNIKTGLGPLLFLTISSYTINLIVISFITIKDFGKPSFFANLLFTLTIITFIFYIIQVSDDCYGNINNLKEMVR